MTSRSALVSFCVAVLGSSLAPASAATTAVMRIEPSSTIVPPTKPYCSAGALQMLAGPGTAPISKLTAQGDPLTGPCELTAVVPDGFDVSNAHFLFDGRPLRDTFVFTVVPVGTAPGPASPPTASPAETSYTVTVPRDQEPAIGTPESGPGWNRITNVPTSGSVKDGLVVIGAAPATAAPAASKAPKLISCAGLEVAVADPVVRRDRRSIKTPAFTTTERTCFVTFESSVKITSENLRVSSPTRSYRAFVNY